MDNDAIIERDDLVFVTNGRNNSEEKNNFVKHEFKPAENFLTNDNDNDDEEDTIIRGSPDALCIICGMLETKYDCPACLRQTCSVQCVKEHKKKFECSGVRKRAKFIQKNDMDVDMLRDDNCLLEDGAQLIESAVRRRQNNSLSAKTDPRHQFENGVRHDEYRQNNRATAAMVSQTAMSQEYKELAKSFAKDVNEWISTTGAKFQLKSNDLKRLASERGTTVFCAPLGLDLRTLNSSSVNNLRRRKPPVTPPTTTTTITTKDINVIVPPAAPAGAEDDICSENNVKHQQFASRLFWKVLWRLCPGDDVEICIIDPKRSEQCTIGECLTAMYQNKWTPKGVKSGPPKLQPYLSPFFDEAVDPPTLKDSAIALLPVPIRLKDDLGDYNDKGIRVPATHWKINLNQSIRELLVGKAIVEHPEIVITKTLPKSAVLTELAYLGEPSPDLQHPTPMIGSNLVDNNHNNKFHNRQVPPLTSPPPNIPHTLTQSQMLPLVGMPTRSNSCESDINHSGGSISPRHHVGSKWLQRAALDGAVQQQSTTTLNNSNNNGSMSNRINDDYGGAMMSLPTESSATAIISGLPSTNSSNNSSSSTAVKAHHKVHPYYSPHSFSHANTSVVAASACKINNIQQTEPIPSDSNNTIGSDQRQVPLSVAVANISATPLNTGSVPHRISPTNSATSLQPTTDEPSNLSAPGPGRKWLERLATNQL